jgi:hypothetical protein
VGDDWGVFLAGLRRERARARERRFSSASVSAQHSRNAHPPRISRISVSSFASFAPAAKGLHFPNPIPQVPLSLGGSPRLVSIFPPGTNHPHSAHRDRQFPFPTCSFFFGPPPILGGEKVFTSPASSTRIHPTTFVLLQFFLAPLISRAFFLFLFTPPTCFPSDRGIVFFWFF